jgi:hypothetical protein
MIQTTGGDCKVGDLKVGDLLPTALGGQRPIQWFGCYLFKKDVRPVRVARSALAPDFRAPIFVSVGDMPYLSMAC